MNRCVSNIWPIIAIFLFIAQSLLLSLLDCSVYKFIDYEMSCLWIVVSMICRVYDLSCIWVWFIWVCCLWVCCQWVCCKLIVCLWVFCLWIVVSISLLSMNCYVYDFVVYEFIFYELQWQIILLPMNCRVNELSCLWVCCLFIVVSIIWITELSRPGFSKTLDLV